VRIETETAPPTNRGVIQFIGASVRSSQQRLSPLLQLVMRRLFLSVASLSFNQVSQPLQVAFALERKQQVSRSIQQRSPDRHVYIARPTNTRLVTPTKWQSHLPGNPAANQALNPRRKFRTRLLLRYSALNPSARLGHMEEHPPMAPSVRIRLNPLLQRSAQQVFASAFRWQTPRKQANQTCNKPRTRPARLSTVKHG